MTIQLKFMFNREVMCFKVVGTEIWYSDRLWNKGIRCIPQDEKFIETIRNSRNKYPSSLIDMFNLPEKDKKEYEEIAPKGEEALAETIIKDCRIKGLILLSKEKI